MNQESLFERTKEYHLRQVGKKCWNYNHICFNTDIMVKGIIV